ncbi:hypothetical protein [Salinithrix halophila]|uniref:Uncharacterized protein n=1 Tax=Salinithrix halophila TaxID=1485204 RepID=A0ABV8JAI9_9BACL
MTRWRRIDHSADTSRLGIEAEGPAYKRVGRLVRQRRRHDARTIMRMEA